MYEQFFQLQRRPFAATPDPACFFTTESIDEVLNQLKVCVEHGQGIGILTAPAGMGKTLFCQRLVKDLGEQYLSIFLGNSNFPTRRSLLQAILFELGVEPSRKDEQELRHELRNAVGETCHDQEAVVLVVDEAHLFEAVVLEELRLLVDFSDEGRALVRVILSGQLELEERMTDRQFDAINQRISAHASIEPLSIAESIAYVRHRIEWTGGNPDEVISEAGTLIIARASCGVPRCLNQLADHSLLLGFAADESPLSEGTVREALEDLKQLPLHWNDVNDADRMIESCSEQDSAVDADSSEPEQEATFQDAAAPIETNSDSHVESAPDETAAPFAVFEFGDNESPMDDDEGETLDEVTPIEVPVSSSTDGAGPGHNAFPGSTVGEPAVEDEFGSPSPPVSEICGVVLDLSSEVCGVSEYSGPRPGSSRVAREDKSASMSDLEVSSEDGSSRRAEDAPQESTDDTSGTTSVFEFGDPADEAASGELEPAISETEIESTDAEAAETAEDESAGTPVPADDQAPTEEEVLADIASVELEIAEVTAEFDLDSEPTADAEPVVVLDEEARAEEASQEGADEPHARETEVEQNVAGAPVEPVIEAEIPACQSEFEFEIVSDPYSLIQEPLSAGIVWDVPPPPELPPAVQREADHQGEEVSIESSRDSNEMSTAAAGEIAQTDPESTPGHSDETDSEVTQIESENAILEQREESISEELGEAIMRDWVDDSADPQDEQLDVVEAPDAELSLFAAETDDPSLDDPSPNDVEPESIREVHPDRYIEAIVPMLDEIDDRFTSRNDRADQPERSASDIEAELIEAISTDDADVEDKIGADVLDLCMETQWSLQQDRVQSEHQEDGTTAIHSDSEPEPYDIVEPEESPAASFVGQVSELSHETSAELASSSDDQARDTRRPFGRLFSELRRRST